MNSLQKLTTSLPTPTLQDPTYNHYAKQFIGFLVETNKPFSIDSIIEYIELYRVSYSASTVNVLKCSLKAYVESLARNSDRFIEVNAKIQEVFKHIKTGKPIKTVDLAELPTEEEIEVLLTGGYYYDYRSQEPIEKWFEFTAKEKLIIETLSKTGLRIFELITLEKGRSSKQGKFYKIQFTGKGRKDREIFLPVELYRRIDKEFSGRKYLFEDFSFMPAGKMDLPEKIKRYTENYRTKVKDRISYYSLRLIGKKITPHDFRHYFATKWVKEGKTVKAVSNWLGHSSTSVTLDMYVHDNLDPEELFK